MRLCPAPAERQKSKTQSPLLALIDYYTRDARTGRNTSNPGPTPAERSLGRERLAELQAARRGPEVVHRWQPMLHSAPDPYHIDDDRPTSRGHRASAQAAT